MGNERQLISAERQGMGVENLDWPLYDSLPMVASARQTLIFFQNSGNVVNGRARTNMKNPGSLPAGEEFLITGLRMSFRNPTTTPFTVTALPELNQLINTGWFDVYREPATFYEGHLTELFNQAFINGGLATVDGGGVFEKGLKFKRPIILLAVRHFEIKVTLDAPAFAGGFGADTLLYVYLHGIKRRNK